MARKKTNGMTGDFRYSRQQKHIADVAASLGCEAFRPNYHGQERDGNTVLLYMPEDAAHNRKVDQEFTQYNSADEARMYGCTDERYIYRPYFWSFENTDRNGMLTFDFANFGSLDLRGLNWEKVIEGSIKLAYYKKQQAKYAASCGGLGAVSEADETFNGLNRDIIQAFHMANQGCFLCSYNGSKEEADIFRPYNPAVVVRNFEADFLVAKKSPELQEEVLAWRRTADTKHLEKAQSIVSQSHGELLMWT